MRNDFNRFLNLGIIVIIILFSIPIISLSTINIHGSSTATYSISMGFEENKTAHPNSGEPGIVIFNGSIEVECSQPTLVIVELSAEDTWNSSIIDPTTMYFRRTGTQSFTVQVIVPISESCETIGLVIVTCNSRMYGSGGTGMEISAVGFVNIAQFYDFSLSSQRSTVDATAGSTSQLDLTIENQGNGNDIFSIDIININDLTNNDLEATLSFTQVTLPRGENETVQIVVHTPIGKDGLGDHEIKMQVSSDNGLKEGVQPKIYIFNLRITGSTGTKPSTKEPEPGENSLEVGKDEKYQVDYLNNKSFLMLLIIFIFVFIIIIGIVFWKRNRKR